MIRPLPLWIVLFLMCSVLSSHELIAQDEEAVEEWFDRAESFSDRGQWARALPLFEKVVQARAEDGEAAAGLAVAALAVGRYSLVDDLSARWIEKQPESREWLLLRLEFLRETGRDEAALELIRKHLERRKSDFLVESLLGDILESRGDDKGAAEIFDRLIDQAKEVVVESTEDLTGLARAYRFYSHGGNAAESALLEAKKKDPKSWRPLIELARLYGTIKELPENMKSEVLGALKLRPNWPAFHLLLAEAADLRLGMAEQQKVEAVDAALAVNPHLPGALALRGFSELGDALWEKARATFESGLKGNSRHLECLAGLAAHSYLVHDLTGYEARRKEVLILDPTCGRMDRLIAKVLNERRRWPEALDMMRRAVEIDPRDFRSWDDLARYAFYLGREDEGEGALRRANLLVSSGSVWRNNMFEVNKLLRTKYKTIDLKNFILKVHQLEAPLLERFFPEFIERSFAEFVERYEFKPESRILFEVFRRHDDFSVRTMGTSGLGALGVCFGPTIVMDSPRAQRPGTYNWAGTAHHELAHVFTLMKSRGRTPRWLTEGLSSWEECRRSPSWGRDMEDQLYDAVHNGKLFGVVEFDAGFHGPRIIFAYFQAGLTCQFMEETFSFKKVLDMLELYGRDLQTPEILKQVFGLSPAEFDQRFEDYVRRHLEPMDRVPNYDRDRIQEWKNALQVRDDDLTRINLALAYLRNNLPLDADDTLKPLLDRGVQHSRLDLFLAERARKAKRTDLAEKHYRAALEAGSKDYDMQVFLARQSEKSGKSADAVEFWKQAAANHRFAPEPHINLARLYEGEGNLDATMAEFEILRGLIDTAVDVRWRLVEYQQKKDNPEAILALLDEIHLVMPFDPKLHWTRGEVLVRQKKWEPARIALELVLECTPEEALEADARRELGRVLIELGKNDDALYHLDRAVQLDPNDREAKELLKRAEGK